LARVEVTIRALQDLERLFDFIAAEALSAPESSKAGYTEES
jgi:hypothetical protein